MSRRATSSGFSRYLTGGFAPLNSFPARTRVSADRAATREPRSSVAPAESQAARMRQAGRTQFLPRLAASWAWSESAPLPGDVQPAVGRRRGVPAGCRQATADAHTSSDAKPERSRPKRAQPPLFTQTSANPGRRDPRLLREPVRAGGCNGRTADAASRHRLLRRAAARMQPTPEPQPLGSGSAPGCEPRSQCRYSSSGCGHGWQAGAPSVSLLVGVHELDDGQFGGVAAAGA